MANIVLKNANGENVVYKGITSIKFNTEDGTEVEFVEQATQYVQSNYIEQTLLMTNWSGTTYTLTFDTYLNTQAVQIGIPPESSLPNAKLLIQNPLRISHLEKTSSSLTLTISALKPPTSDLIVALWGLQ